MACMCCPAFSEKEKRTESVQLQHCTKRRGRITMDGEAEGQAPDARVIIDGAAELSGIAMDIGEAGHASDARVTMDELSRITMDGEAAGQAPNAHVTINGAGELSIEGAAQAPAARERKHPLQEIEEDVALEKLLELWVKEEEILTQRIDRKENSKSGAQNEIYQLFGLYFVFQGVVFSALFQAAGQGLGGGQQASGSLCHLFRWPFLLSLLTSVATIAATLHKLHDRGNIENAVATEKAQAQALHFLIEDLRAEGAAFDKTRPPSQQEASACSVNGFWACIFRRGTRLYTVSVLAVLAFFSVIILLACRRVLCQLQ